jgi:hypothetical protein
VIPQVNLWTNNLVIPVIGVPYSVAVWAAIGSLAAILYRFYNQRRGRLYDEIRWLIARPVIGIIMGCFAYLVIVSGLELFGVQTGAGIVESIARPQVFWLFAFLGGFSDKFYNGLVDLVVIKFAGKKDENEPSKNL